VKDKMNKNISVLSIAIAIIIFLRCILDGNNNIIYIVAGINIVAIIFVVYTIIEKILNNIIDKIKKSKVPEQILNREIAGTQVKIWGWSIVIGVIVILVYFWKWCSGLGNDIISILALGISILDDEIVKKITDNYKI
jgi:hypothetical protein